ncbi:hypothetical protein AYA84_RS20095 [Acinetobacter baumannii]|uniref:hypothetical protein n=1 Tax=Acinetobacter baumannii TaxID=470 RepID=UPI0007A3A9B7|nr:hypothetical protein [Acinetobacter baumannii]EHU1763494.1 hypothetical protein [Acinetobacter baumannii]EHU1766386.1 hypothetical protein [Acinetobacter baumannii]EHU2662261.1 hypothetical protein [Acinetobacter baumannii]EHU2902692.1 hypothetical protein [Acinetobacter baumannii]EHU2905369.1 hypothetical protein [Acinetobacter baumannii]
MTDLNKLRSEFENLSEIAEILNEEKSHFNGDFYNLPFNSCAESFINGAWYAWQEKVKAQAVPDTHIVVPKQPTPKMIDATWDFDEEIIEMSSNTRNEFIWKKMVEASESGAEG